MTDVAPTAEAITLNETPQVLVDPIDELSAITSNPEWRAKYAENGVRSEAERLATFDRQINQEAKKSAGQNLRKVLGENLPKEVYQEKFPELVKAEEARLRGERGVDYEKVVSELAAAKAKLETSLKAFDQELAARRDDPNLKYAFDVWGRSPNHAGDRGITGHGYNAGVIHYFEYQAYKDKSGHNTGSMSIDGFIDWSKRLGEIVNGKRPTEVQTIRKLEDDSGKQAMYVLTKDRFLIISYIEKPGEAPKVVTAIPGQNEGVLLSRVDSEVKTPVVEKQAKRLNYLGTGTRAL